MKIYLFFFCRDFKDDVQKLELNFLAELGLAWGKEEMGSYYLSPKVIGRTQGNNELLEKFLKRNPEQRHKFAATEPEVRKTITATSNKYEKSVFLAMGPLNRGSGADGRTIHTGVLIVLNDTKGKICNYYSKKIINYSIHLIIIIYFFFLDYYFNPMTREDAAGSPHLAIVKARAEMPKDSNGRAVIKMAFGEQTRSRDCPKRCLVFIAKFFEGEEEVKKRFTVTYDYIQRKLFIRNKFISNQRLCLVFF